MVVPPDGCADAGVDEAGGVGVEPGAALAIGTTEIVPALADPASLTTIRRSLFCEPNTVDASWLRATG